MLNNNNNYVLIGLNYYRYLAQGSAHNKALVSAEAYDMYFRKDGT